jgi:outer membrane protein TolC
MSAREARIAMRRLVLVPLLCVVHGCQYVPPAPIDPEANARRLEQRALDDPAVVSALTTYRQERPDGSHWSLDQLTIAAWVLRSDVALARAELEAAQAESRVESRRQGSGIATTFERVTNAASGVTPWVLGAAAALTFETAGRRSIRRDRAAARESAMQWQLAQRMWEARDDVTRALFDRLFAERVLALDEEELRLRLANLDWVETRLAFGVATAEERLFASEARSQVESQRELDLAENAAAFARLAGAVGVVPSGFANIEPTFPDLDALPAFDAQELAAAQAVALSNRLDVRRALAEYDVAEQDLRAAIAAQYPNVSLGPGYLVDQADRKITLSLDLPSLPSPRTAAAIDSAVAVRAVAAARFDDVQANALRQIETNLVFYRAALRALDAAQSAEREAERSLAAIRRRFEAGGADRGALVASEIDLVVRKRATLETRRTLVNAGLALQDAVQQPLLPRSSIAVAAATEDQE